MTKMIEYVRDLARKALWERYKNMPIMPIIIDPPLVEIDGPILINCAECGKEAWINDEKLRKNPPSRWVCAACLNPDNEGV